MSGEYGMVDNGSNSNMMDSIALLTKLSKIHIKYILISIKLIEVRIEFVK